MSIIDSVLFEILGALVNQLICKWSQLECTHCSDACVCALQAIDAILVPQSAPWLGQRRAEGSQGRKRKRRGSKRPRCTLHSCQHARSHAAVSHARAAHAQSSAPRVRRARVRADHVGWLSKYRYTVQLTIADSRNLTYGNHQSQTLVYCHPFGGRVGMLPDPVAASMAWV